ncbi:MAG: ZIP family metal transporter [Proteobacteria bacterium]|nr:ZIP family metal transporter [Pseudomonadota bacterium]
MTATLLSFAAFAATLGGGAFALHFRASIHFILAFTAGVLLGVVAFDLLPEIAGLAGRLEVSMTGAMIAMVAGFLVFHGIEKFILVHHGHERYYAAHRHPAVGVLSALALVGHSFMDGVAIGLGFQVSPAVGIAVALAVVGHDFCDGMNTVGLMLVHRNTPRRSIAMLVLDAIAPVLGALATLAFSMPPLALMLYLGFFAGFLLYIGAADVLPEAHSHAAPGTAGTLIALTTAGAAFIFGVVGMIG